MQLKERVEKELASVKAWANDTKFQAKLAKAEASSELRKRWMETEQNIHKLEARLSDLGEEADDAAQKLLDGLKESWSKVKKASN